LTGIDREGIEAVTRSEAEFINIFIFKSNLIIAEIVWL